MHGNKNARKHCTTRMQRFGSTGHRMMFCKKYNFVSLIKRHVKIRTTRCVKPNEAPRKQPGWYQSTVSKYLKIYRSRKWLTAASNWDKGSYFGQIQIQSMKYERIGNTTATDLVHEGLPDISVDDFINKWGKGDKETKVWVIWFKYRRRIWVPCG